MSAATCSQTPRLIELRVVSKRFVKALDAAAKIGNLFGAGMREAARRCGRASTSRSSRARCARRRSTTLGRLAVPPRCRRAALVARHGSRPRGGGEAPARMQLPGSLRSLNPRSRTRRPTIAGASGGQQDYVRERLRGSRPGADACRFPHQSPAASGRNGRARARGEAGVPGLRRTVAVQGRSRRRSLNAVDLRESEPHLPLHQPRPGRGEAHQRSRVSCTSAAWSRALRGGRRLRPHAGATRRGRQRRAGEAHVVPIKGVRRRASAERCHFHLSCAHAPQRCRESAAPRGRNWSPPQQIGPESRRPTIRRARAERVPLVFDFRAQRADYPADGGATGRGHARRATLPLRAGARRHADRGRLPARVHRPQPQPRRRRDASRPSAVAQDRARSNACLAARGTAACTRAHRGRSATAIDAYPDHPPSRRARRAAPRVRRRVAHRLPPDGTARYFARDDGRSDGTTCAPVNVVNRAGTATSRSTIRTRAELAQAAGGESLHAVGMIARRDHDVRAQCRLRQGLRRTSRRRRGRRRLRAARGAIGLTGFTVRADTPHHRRTAPRQCRDRSNGHCLRRKMKASCARPGRPPARSPWRSPASSTPDHADRAGVRAAWDAVHHRHAAPAMPGTSSTPHRRQRRGGARGHRLRAARADRSASSPSRSAWPCRDSRKGSALVHANASTPTPPAQVAAVNVQVGQRARRRDQGELPSSRACRRQGGIWHSSIATIKKIDRPASRGWKDFAAQQGPAAQIARVAAPAPRSTRSWRRTTPRWAPRSTRTCRRPPPAATGRWPRGAAWPRRRRRQRQARRGDQEDRRQQGLHGLHDGPAGAAGRQVHGEVRCGPRRHEGGRPRQVSAAPRMKLNDAVWGALLMLLGVVVLVHVQSFPAIPGRRSGRRCFRGWSPPASPCAACC